MVLKALLKISETFRAQTLPELLESDFVRCVVVLATYGTGFNRKWIVDDLEVCTSYLLCRLLANTWFSLTNYFAVMIH